MSQQDDEAIAACNRGERVINKHTRQGPWKNKPEACCHSWRTIACNSEEDVVECLHCGKQTVTRCNFDEEYS